MLQIPDNYQGYELDCLCIPPHYVNDLKHVIIPKGLIMDRSGGTKVSVSGEREGGGAKLHGV